MISRIVMLVACYVVLLSLSFPAFAEDVAEDTYEGIELELRVDSNEILPCEPLHFTLSLRNLTIGLTHHATCHTIRRWEEMGSDNARKAAISVRLHESS